MTSFGTVRKENYYYAILFLFLCTYSWGCLLLIPALITLAGAFKKGNSVNLKISVTSIVVLCATLAYLQTKIYSEGFPLAIDPTEKSFISRENFSFWFAVLLLPLCGWLSFRTKMERSNQRSYNHSQESS